MYALGKSGVVRLWPYMVLAAALWYAVLLCGIHATVAGVLAAVAIPVVSKPGAGRGRRSTGSSICIAPWVLRGSCLCSVFANAGVSAAVVDVVALLAPLPLGIAAGLFLGKQLGIFAAVASALRGAWRPASGVRPGARSMASRRCAGSVSR